MTAATEQMISSNELIAAAERKNTNKTKHENEKYCRPIVTRFMETSNAERILLLGNCLQHHDGLTAKPFVIALFDSHGYYYTTAVIFFRSIILYTSFINFLRLERIALRMHWFYYDVCYFLSVNILSTGNLASTSGAVNGSKLCLVDALENIIFYYFPYSFLNNWTKMLEIREYL